jgi:lipid-binding SYLF domain-containing protein
MPVAAIYTYSRSQGLFAGVSIDGQVLVSRDKANHAYYGRPVTPQQILSGQVKPPKDALKLTRALQRY